MVNENTRQFRLTLFDKAADLAMNFDDYSGLIKISKLNESLMNNQEGLQIRASERIIKGINAYIKWVKHEKGELKLTDEALELLDKDYLRFREEFFGEKIAPE